MTREEILNVFAAMGWVEHQNLRQGWVTTACPMAPWTHGGGVDKNPSFGIKIGENPPVCVCLACGLGGTLTTLMTDLIVHMVPGTPGRKQAVKIMQEIPVTEIQKGLAMPVRTKTKVIIDPLLPETWLDQYPLAHDNATALSYLMYRGVGSTHAAGMDLRYDSERQRIMFPIRDWSGQLRGAQGRAIGDSKPKYLFYKYNGVSCGHSVMLGEQVVNTEKPVILVEGAFDYAKLYPYTKQILVLWGCRVTASRIERLNRCMKIYTAFDADEAGGKARQKLIEKLPKTTNLVLPPGVSDVGEADHDTLKRLASYVDSYGKLG